MVAARKDYPWDPLRSPNGRHSGSSIGGLNPVVDLKTIAQQWTSEIGFTLGTKLRLARAPRLLQSREASH